jgi:hypothetical protein
VRYLVRLAARRFDACSPEFPIIDAIRAADLPDVHAECAAVAKRPSTKSPDNLPQILRQPIFIELKTGISVLQTRLFTEAELLEQLSRKVEERLAALLNHYNISIEASDKWKVLSCRLAEQLGLLVLTTEQPQIGRPRLSSMENWIRSGGAMLLSSERVPRWHPLSELSLFARRMSPQLGSLRTLVICPTS